MLSVWAVQYTPERQAFSQAIVNARTPASVLKLHNGELMGRVADKYLQLFGGYGDMAEYPTSRFCADARVLRIDGGTSEIMKSW